MGDRDRHPGPVPERWLECPRKSNKLIAEKFIAFKTPLDSRYYDQLPASSYFTLEMLFSSMKSHKVKLGLWIDLTYTSRFYHKEDVEKGGCRYTKLQCRGHGETPSEEQTKTFIKLCSNFIRQNPLDIIGVHCTHGFNRTGFMLVAYMVEEMDMSLETALREFSISRPPGIYKQDYIEELYKRYDDIADMIPAPERPSWCFEFDDSKDGSEPAASDSSDGRRKRKEFVVKNPVFMEGVGGVTVVTEPDLARLQRRAQDMCGYRKPGFPGSQPVSMDTKNLKFLGAKPYRVSWKADGTRYMMLIDSDAKVYFVDRDNSVFKVSGIKFFKSEKFPQPLVDTLLDGEMVIDNDNGKLQPRYLVYDVIRLRNQAVRKENFDHRYNLIKTEVIEPRCRAIQEGVINKNREPFSIRRKEFWGIDHAEKLLSDKFAKQLGHEPDGLIFQPAKAEYKCGSYEELLKWKPSSLNSVDFRMKIGKEMGQGVLQKKVCYLYTGGQDMPFSFMKYTKSLQEYENKIIECKYENGQWVFMRERTDKSFPNSYKTATAVCQSIKDPVTEEILIDFIHNHRFRESEMMPPPQKIPRRH